MKYTGREIFEDVAATILTAGAVLGYTATHESWNVWLIGDSRRWTAGLLTVIVVAMFALVARHIGPMLLAMLGMAAIVLGIISFWSATLTPLSLFAALIVLVWAVAVVHDVVVVPRKPPIPI